MARVPIDLVRRGVDMGSAPSHYEKTQNRLFEMRRRLHLRLRDLTDDDMRQVNMCTFESMMMQLWREGHIWTGRMMTEFVELDKIARKICMLVAPELRRMSLEKEKKLLRLLADELCSAEDAMNAGDYVAECRHLLHLAAESAAGGASWWWLTERLLNEAAASVREAGDNGETAAKTALATGAFLLDQLHESGEAVVALTNAMRLSKGQNWHANARLMMTHRLPSERIMMSPTTKPEIEELNEFRPKTPPDCGTDDNPVSLFECASAVLCRALIQEARRARIGCAFGVVPGKKTHTERTQAKNPTAAISKGNPFKAQVENVEVRTPRVLTEKTFSATHPPKAEQKLDFIAMLKDDIGEPEVQDPSKIDSGSAAGFCREAAQHAENARRRDLEQCALLELGMSLQSGRHYEEALQPLKTVLRLYKDDGNSAQEIKTHFQIALCYQRMGKYKETQEELQKALLRAQETANHALIFAAHKYLGLFYLKTSQRHYATTHLALALIESDYSKNNYQRCLIRVLVGLAGANELMPEFISLLRSTESPSPEGKSNMLKLLKWKESRTPFWPENLKTSRVVTTLEVTLPPRVVSESGAGEESSVKSVKTVSEGIDNTEAGDTLQETLESASGYLERQKEENDKTEYVGRERDARSLEDMQTGANNEMPSTGEE